jgi:uncharacterized protein (DUF1015 family)
MAKIFPFRALRYDPGKVSPTQVVTQPYDKISPEMQDHYYSASPYNLVRIILGKSRPGDNESENVYSRAAANLREWQREGILRLDDDPSLYFYTQTFRVPGAAGETTAERRGFIALGQIEDYEKRVVFRHEQTLSKPKADRLNLLRATQAHAGQIFMLYSDPAGAVDRAFGVTGNPTTEVTDEYGVIHRLWKVADPDAIERIQALMSDKKLIIADGHHRYETALNYRNEMRGKAGDAEDAPHERMMMTFVNMDSPGLVILPTHRVVFGLENFSLGDVIRRVRDYFRVVDLGHVELASATARLRDAGREGTALLALAPNAAFLLQAKPNLQSPLLAGLSERQQALDVVRLHGLILEGTLGMSEEDIRQQKHLKYVRETGEAVRLLQEGANIAFLINPVSIDQLREIAFAGEVMPQKSTDFYPKLLSGLAIYSLQVAGADSHNVVQGAQTSVEGAD